MECAEITIEPGRLDELEVFADFWLAMFEEVGVLHEPDLPADWRARFRAYFERRIATSDARFFVARDGSEIVGTAGAIVADGYPFEIHGIKRGYIFGVRVAPKARHRGLATHLTESCTAFLRELGCKKIRLHASPFGRPVYEKLGFTPTNEMEIR